LLLRLRQLCDERARRVCLDRARPGVLVSRACQRGAQTGAGARVPPHPVARVRDGLGRGRGRGLARRRSLLPRAQLRPVRRVPREGRRARSLLRPRPPERLRRAAPRDPALLRPRDRLQLLSRDGLRPRPAHHRADRRRARLRHVAAPGRRRATGGAAQATLKLFVAAGCGASSRKTSSLYSPFGQPLGFATWNSFTAGPFASISSVFSSTLAVFPPRTNDQSARSFALP